MIWSPIHSACCKWISLCFSTPFLFYKHKAYKHTEAENVQHLKHTFKHITSLEKTYPDFIFEAKHLFKRRGRLCEAIQYGF